MAAAWRPSVTVSVPPTILAPRSVPKTVSLPPPLMEVLVTRPAEKIRWMPPLLIVVLIVLPEESTKLKAAEHRGASRGAAGCNLLIAATADDRGNRGAPVKLQAAVLDRGAGRAAAEVNILLP
jgi:hypothetical protein